MIETKRDIFICHAKEDKHEIVYPLVEALNQMDISCWYDEAEIQWGDSITQKVNEGLSISRYVLVVFSASFIKKKWPQRELYAVLNQEASTGEVKVLPLLVGTEQEKRNILQQFPIFGDKCYLSWDEGLRGIVSALLSRLGRGDDELNKKVPRESPGNGLRIPLPKIKKRLTQLDKDIFLRNGFIIVKEYFHNALQELGRHYQEVETDFAEVHNYKFVATIYLRGEIMNKCKIWIGGLSSSDAIAYQTGQFNMENDNFFNDIISVTDDEQSLGFKPSGMRLIGHQYSETPLLTAEQTAEYLWRGFTESLG